VGRNRTVSDGLAASRCQPGALEGLPPKWRWPSWLPVDGFRKRDGSIKFIKMRPARVIRVIALAGFSQGD
jgi:hypothetical protein